MNSFAKIYEKIDDKYNTTQDIDLMSFKVKIDCFFIMVEIDPCV